MTPPAPERNVIFSMRKTRILRRHALALALVPAAALTLGPAPTFAAPEGAQKATVKSKDSVRFGNRIELRGEFPGSADTEVAILHRAASDTRFKRVSSTRTGPSGQWAKKVEPRRTGDWRAQIAGAQPGDAPTLEAAEARDTQSNAKRIGVRSVTQVNTARDYAIVGREVEVRGRVLPAGTRRDVVVDVGRSTVRTHADRKGRFDVDWRANATGTYRVSALAKGNRDSSGSKDADGRLTVYRYASASWYGPGLYGNRTACGQTLTPSTRGVAHKSLPCGTELSLRHGNNSVTVRVIDRGPYVAGREFDLTEATRNDLGFGSTGSVLSSR